MENKNKVFATLIAAIMVFSFLSVAQLLPVSAQTGLSPTCTSTVSGYSGSFNYCTVTLVTGWNLVSLPVVPNSTYIPPSQLKGSYSNYFSGPANSVNNLFTHSYLGLVSKVYSYSARTKTWTFCIVVSGPSCTGTLTTMVDGSAYWVFTTGAAVLGVGGWIVQPGAVPPAYTLYQGWNLVGFKPQPTIAPEETENYFESVASYIDAAHVYTWSYSSPAVWVLLGPTDSIPVGNGMWVFLTTTSAVLYP